MSADLFNAEQEALRSLMELLDQAKKTRALYERAHMTFPEPLKRVLGMNGAGGQGAVSHIPAPDVPVPAEAKPDWAWVRQEVAAPTSIGLAVLREGGGPIRAKDVVERVLEILPNTSRGSIANLGTRLEEEDVIRRTDDGWELKKQEAAPIFNQGYVWGPETIFTKQELASHRRDAILYTLSFFPTGLQTVQIVDELRKCSWVHAPINKDLVKDDMAILASQRKVRRGSSKKWNILKLDVKASL